MNEQTSKMQLPQLRNRQFTVNQESQQIDREVFWYKNELVQKIKISWQQGSRKGYFPLYQLILDKRKVEQIKTETTLFSVIMKDNNKELELLESKDCFRFECKTGQVYTISFQINKAISKIFIILFLKLKIYKENKEI